MERRAAEVGREVSTFEVSALEVYALEVSALEVSTLELSALEVYFGVERLKRYLFLPGSSDFLEEVSLYKLFLDFNIFKLFLFTNDFSGNLG